MTVKFSRSASTLDVSDYIAISQARIAKNLPRGGGLRHVLATLVVIIV